jgi:hypothetical protein
MQWQALHIIIIIIIIIIIVIVIVVIVIGRGCWEVEQKFYRFEIFQTENM